MHRTLALSVVLALPFVAATNSACGSSEDDDGSSGSASASAMAPCSGPTTDPGGEGAPGPQLIGRFDLSNGTAQRTAWPGACIVARFEGTGIKAKLGSTAGGDGNETWLNVVIDGIAKPPLKVVGASQLYTLGSGLGGGVHTIELEKRTEPKWGTLVFEGFTPEGGDSKLLAPPPRPARRIEWVGESTIDGFGVDGDFKTTCKGGAPAQLDNARKSVAFYASKALSSERHIVAVSAKGVVKNEPGDTSAVFFPAIYTRTLPDDPKSTWSFASWTPDVVVLSLGGADLGSTNTLPSGFEKAYDALVVSIRQRHANAHIVMSVWSQIKDEKRKNLEATLERIKTAHAGDAKLHSFSFKQADYPDDETGCSEHANDAHHKETSGEILAFIRSKTGWE